MSFTYDVTVFVDTIKTGFDYRVPMSVIDQLNLLVSKCGCDANVYKQQSFRQIVFHSIKPATTPSTQDVSTTIRVILNKISPKTYLECIDKILAVLSVAVLPDEHGSDCGEKIRMIGNTMLIAFTNNRFYSKLYADVFSACVENHCMLMECFIDQYDIFVESVNSLVYVDPTMDYDLFCETNTKHEKLKAFACLTLNIAKNGIIDGAYVNDIVTKMSEKIQVYIHTVENVHIVDEMVDIIFILYDTTFLNSSNIAFVKMISSYKPRQFPGMSSRSIFKLMDIL
jgi:hypothetical protein